MAVHDGWSSADTPSPMMRVAPEAPSWPVLAIFWAFPFAWLLGVGAFFHLLMAPILLAYLLLLFRRGEFRIPTLLLPWLAFLVVVIASGVMIDSTGRAIGWLFRLGNYTAAALAFLYIVNSAPRRLSDERLLTALTVFWVWVVIGGFLGMLFPFGYIRTPLSFVLPGFLMDNELVNQWAIPSFSEVQQPWGSPEVFARPSAPFAYSNGWGSTYALLTPFVLATLIRLNGFRRVALGGLLVASSVPLAATLNRGALIAMGAGLLYVAFRTSLTGRVGPLLGTVALSFVAAAGIYFSGLYDRIALRTTYSPSTLTRSAIYRETFERTLASPILGWGGPRPSRLLEVSVGTQGHLWNVMFSHGFVALALFATALAVLAWGTRHATGPGLAGHVAIVMAMVAMTFYGFDGPQLLITLVGAALAFRTLRVDLGVANRTVRVSSELARR